MELILIIFAILVLDILALRFGVDSRILDVRDRRPWWPDSFDSDARRDSAQARLVRLRYETRLERLVSL